MKEVFVADLAGIGRKAAQAINSVDVAEIAMATLDHVAHDERADVFALMLLNLRA